MNQAVSDNHTTVSASTDNKNMPSQSAWSLLKHDDGIATLIFDMPNEKVNKLSSPVMQELDRVLTSLQSDTSIKALIIKSNKEGFFIAGADIAEIKDIKSSKEGLAKVQNGQGIMNKLENLPFPTIAAIKGACLGGGFELALACSFRIASDHPKTLIGLPEVQLGIIPGFGGTQRLPRLIGLQKSLPLILTGKALNASKAERQGLIDKMVPDGFFDAWVMDFAKDVSTSAGQKKIRDKRKLKGLNAFFLEKTPVGKALVFHLSKKQVMTTTKGHYPAPLGALRAVQFGMGTTLQKGLEKEATIFSKLVVTEVSKNLINLFYLTEGQKKYTGIQEVLETKDIHKAGVLGSGLMGGGIAWLLSDKNIPVRMKDIAWDSIAKGFEAAKKIYDQLVKIRKLMPHEAINKLHSITGTLTYAGFESADIVIEAVVENMGLKKKVFAELESVVKEDTILATNTSALSVTEMASDLAHPDRFVGMHFFSPVNRMPLVEVIPGEKTSPSTIASTVALAKALKKTPIVVQDCPGFLVNRILLPYVNEAVLCLQDGADIERIDKIASDFGMPLGPLALADEVGLDVGYKVSKILEEGYGSRMKIADVFHDIYQDETLRGKKTGKGFYIHQGKTKVINPAMKSLIAKHVSKKPMTDQDILDRLTHVMINEAARCLQEKVVENVALLDLAMIMGTGFPPFRGGLCRYADSLGIGLLIRRFDDLKKRYGDRFAPAPFFDKVENFYK